MSSVPAGKRSWKCPECGGESLLSVTQLDPMACDVCLARMKEAGKSPVVPSVADAVAGPIGIWRALPEAVKLGAVFVALVIGFVVGYVAENALKPRAIGTASRPHHSKVELHAKETDSSENATSEEHAETRPDPPGPGYKWVQGRKHKDGTRGEGHWAKDPRYKGDDEPSLK